MALLVQKFGGTSVGDTDKIKKIAAKVKHHRDLGDDIIVVVSAMSGETNRLIALAESIQNKPVHREIDVLLATGEQVTIALLSMALIEIGCGAVSFTGSQIAIVTDTAHTKARIQHVDTTKIFTEINKQKVVVIAGFQGRDLAHNITTLGRGGSDTTAVAIAAAVKADECQIYTDVDGVYTTDPRVVATARKMDSITFEEMLEMSSLGAKVLQIRAVEFAGKYGVKLRVLHAFKEGSGTLITFDEENNMEAPLVSGIAFNRDEAKVTLHGIPHLPGIASQILSAVSVANIDVDMIVQNIGEDKTTDFTFTIHRSDYQKTMEIITSISNKLGAKGCSGTDEIAKISIVGVGMRSQAGVAKTMFQCLGEEGINIEVISTSEIKISVVVAEKYIELAVRALHKKFNLDQNPKND